MELAQIKELLKTSKYDFLYNSEELSNGFLFLTLGGSHAYGMENENSDIDIRGVACNSKREILLGTDFGQVMDVLTDTVVYSFNKILELLMRCNPNTIEMLGCKPEHYLILSDMGKELLDCRKMFLSKICIHTFGGYADSQLRRLENKAVRTVEQTKREQYILQSIENAKYEFQTRYFPMGKGHLDLYIGESTQEDYDSEIFMDINLKHYPLRDWAGMWNEMKSIVSSYGKIGKRNANAISHDKLGKHMAHLVRLYFMVFDILEKEEIITYRVKEHELLIKLRNGEFLTKSGQPTEEFYSLLRELEERFEYAKKNTSLPDIPDYKRIEEFKISVNERIVRG